MEKNENLQQGQWSQNVIVADADYIDQVAFNLIVNFERMLGRRIPPADLPRWAECVALDGGLRANGEEQQQTQVVLIHEKQSAQMHNFQPGKYDTELHEQAFRGPLGEFAVNAYPVEDVTTKDGFLLDVLSTMLSVPDVKRIMVIPNAEREGVYDRVRHILRQVPEGKTVTVFAMQPLPGGPFRQEILGYSLLQALGIRAEEIGCNYSALSA